MNTDEKVISMDDYRNPKAPGDSSAAVAASLRSMRRLSLLALVVGLFAVLFSAGLFYKANQGLTALGGDVSGLGARMGTMDVRLAELEKLPAKTKKMVLDNAIMEMAQRASYLSTQVDSQDQAAKLLQAMDLLQQSRQE
jgi:hypothetical protein